MSFTGTGDLLRERSRLRRILSGGGPGSWFRSLSSRLNVSKDEAGVWFALSVE